MGVRVKIFKRIASRRAAAARNKAKHVQIYTTEERILRTSTIKTPLAPPFNLSFLSLLICAHKSTNHTLLTMHTHKRRVLRQHETRQCTHIGRKQRKEKRKTTFSRKPKIKDYFQRRHNHRARKRQDETQGKTKTKTRRQEDKKTRRRPMTHVVFLFFSFRCSSNS